MSPLARDLSTLPKAEARKADGWKPDAEPRFVQLLAEQWQADNDERGPKPRATEHARFRHSDAGGCARAVAFSALDVEPSDSMDLTAVWNTSLGTIVHELWQEALAAKYPDALIEPKVSTIDGEGAGHLDAVITDRRPIDPADEAAIFNSAPADVIDDLIASDGNVEWVIAYELKTVGGFAFKMAVGERGNAEGPKHDHVVQAALNGKAVDADEIVVGYLSKEAISVNAAQRKRITELGRFCAEWTLTRAEYEPIAAAEAERVKGILALLDEGLLPARKFPSTELPPGAVIVDPSAGRWQVQDAEGLILDTGTFWACGYCKYRTVCASTLSGRQPVAEVAVHLGLTEAA